MEYNFVVADSAKCLPITIFPFFLNDKKVFHKERWMYTGGKSEIYIHIFISTNPSSSYADREVFDAVMKSDGYGAQSSLCLQGQVK